MQCAAIETLGGRIILMASRALAACARSPDDYSCVYGRILRAGARAGDPALARRHVRPGARRLLGPYRHPDAAMATCLAGDHRQCGQGGRHQDQPARQGARDRDAPPPAARRAHVYRRRFQLRRADRRRRRRLFRTRCSASSTASPRRPRRPSAACSATTSAPSTTILAPTVPLIAPHLPGADPVLQNRRGVHGLSQRPSGPFHHGRRPAIDALAAAFRRAVPPRRQGRAAARPRRRLPAHVAACLRCTGCIEWRTWPGSRSTPSRVREQWSLSQCIEGCARHGIPAIGPWRDKIGRDGRGGGGAADPRCRVARLRPVPRRHVSAAGRDRRQPPRDRRGGGAGGGVPGDGLRRAAAGLEGPGRRAPPGRGRAGGDLAAGAGGRGHAGVGAAAPDDLRGSVAC